VYGRSHVNVRICSCPKRDKLKEEEETQKNSNSSKTVHTAKKRKLEKTKKSSFLNAGPSQDLRQFNLDVSTAFH